MFCVTGGLDVLCTRGSIGGRVKGRVKGRLGTWTEFGVEVLGVLWTKMSDNREVQLVRCLSG